MSSLDSQILTGLGLRSPRIPLRGRVSQVGFLETSPSKTHISWVLRCSCGDTGNLAKKQYSRRDSIPRRLTNASEHQRDHEPRSGSPELVEVKACRPDKEQHKDDGAGDGRIVVIQFEDGFCRIILSRKKFEWPIELKWRVAVTHIHRLGESRMV